MKVQEVLTNIAQSIFENLTRFFIVMALICKWISAMPLAGY